jgi:hypothetical protein
LALNVYHRAEAVVVVHHDQTDGQFILDWLDLPLQSPQTVSLLLKLSFLQQFGERSCRDVNRGDYQFKRADEAIAMATMRGRDGLHGPFECTGVDCIGVECSGVVAAVGEALRVEFADRDVVGEIGLDDAGHVVALRDASAADLAYADTAVGAPGPTRNDDWRNCSRDQYIAPRNPRVLSFHGDRVHSLGRSR